MKNTIVSLYDCMLNREKEKGKTLYPERENFLKNSQKNGGFLYVSSFYGFQKKNFSQCVGVSNMKNL
jgi:hypothetical protein